MKKQPKTLEENMDRLERALFPEDDRDSLQWDGVERLWKTIRKQVRSLDSAYEHLDERVHGRRFDALS